MGVQDLVRVRALWETRSERTSVAVRNDVVRFVGSAPTPVLAESSLWPVLAGRQAYLLDPFALRVVMESHPEIARDLETKIDAQYFSSVIFQVDPTSAAGRGYYAHLHFGWPITARILERYRFDRQPAADVWIYVPKDPGRVDVTSVVSIVYRLDPMHDFLLDGPRLGWSVGYGLLDRVV